MISEPHLGNHNDFIQLFYPLRYNSNLLKSKTSWYLQRKFNFNLVVKNYLGPAWRAKISRMIGYLFFSDFVPQPEHPSFLIYRNLKFYPISGTVASSERGQKILIRLPFSSCE